MSRITLDLIVQPHEVEVMLSLRTSAVFVYRTVAIIDTGAQQCLFPAFLLDVIDHENPEDVMLEQAGIAKQAFNAIEATIFLKLEDRLGNISKEMAIRAWFADTNKVIIGFQDILDRATLHVDFRQSLTGWVEF